MGRLKFSDFQFACMSCILTMDFVFFTNLLHAFSCLSERKHVEFNIVNVCVSTWGMSLSPSVAVSWAKNYENAH